MRDSAHRDPITRNVQEGPIKPVVATLRVVDGTVLEDAAPLAEVMEPPIEAKRVREGDVFFFLFSPASGVHPSVSRELLEIVRDTYWSAAGSVTAALRRSVSVANRYLFEHNLTVDRSERCYGGLGCAVARGRDLFLIQAGPVWACVMQEKQLRFFPHGETLAHMGIGPLADVRLYHVSAAPGSTLLLAPHTVLRGANEAGLRRILSLRDVGSIADRLQDLGSDRYAALVSRWEPATVRPALHPQRLSQTRRAEMAPRSAVRMSGRSARRDSPRHEPAMSKERASRPEGQHRETRRGRNRGFLLREAGLVLGRSLKRGGQWLGSAVDRVWHGFAAAGAGLLALVKWLLGAARATVRGTLPGSTRNIRRHGRHHPPPKENRTVMIAIAAAIPIVILAAVIIAYRQFGAESRLQGVINQAKDQIALAQAAGADSEAARFHWEQALDRVQAAAVLQPDDPEVQILRGQAQQALDRFDGIERVQLTPLADLGSGNAERRLVLQDQTLFVLDRKDGWTASVPLGVATREGPESQLELHELPALVQTGQRIEGEEIGSLVDATWVDGEGGRRSGALLVLGSDGHLVSHDPAWRSESGAPQLSLVALNPPPQGRSVAVGSYEGRFYVLDITAVGAGQIWRYHPQGDGYPNQPERYFQASPPEGLEQAVDMVIDGHIYVLYDDGRIDKFLGGEPQPFEMRDVPGGIGSIAGFAVDAEGDGSVYIADRDNDRIVVLEPDGRFQAQLRSDPPLTSLEAVAVSQTEGRLYALAAGQIYTIRLP